LELLCSDYVSEHFNAKALSDEMEKGWRENLPNPPGQGMNE
jgi:hypothetical protein